MNRIVFIFLFSGSLFIWNLKSFSQFPKIPTDRIFDRTYLIVTDVGAGTCFSVDYEGQEFIVSVGHLFKTELKDGSAVEVTLYLKKEVKKLTVKVYKPLKNTIDIAVLILPQKISKKESYDLGGDCMFGQDVYFLGYPMFSGKMLFTRDINGQILPLFKKASYAGVIVSKDTVSNILLDGHNNPGFSGSPVIFYDYNDNKYKVIAIISGYFIQENKNKGRCKRSSTNQENSGIISCFGIEDAIAIMNRIKK